MLPTEEKIRKLFGVEITIFYDKDKEDRFDFIAGPVMGMVCVDSTCGFKPAKSRKWSFPLKT